MREIASILSPFIFAIFGAMIFAPLVRWLQRKGVPNTVSVGIVIFFFILIVLFVGLLTVISIVQLNSRIPVYESQLDIYISQLTGFIPLSADFSLGAFLRSITGSLISVALNILGGAINATTGIVLIIVTTGFLLLDSLEVPEKIFEEAEERSLVLKNLGGFGKSLMDYVMIRTETNVITGVGIGIILLLGRIEFAIFWALVIIIFSYIPYIGLFLASIPPVFLALMQYGPVAALIVIAIITVVNTLAENVIFPSLAGRGLELYSSVVFISLVYWAFVLGPAGALISVPLTMAVKSILDSFEETKSLGMLLGPSKSEEKVKEPE
jgi:predicted PurR-regulated permease PerM